MPDPVITLLSELVRIPSHPGVPRQEFGVAASLAEFLTQRGVASRLIEVRDGRPNLIARIDSGRPGPHLVLCGHTDTVPLNRDEPGVGFSGAVVAGALCGRGAADMKGALAAMAAALVALQAGSSLAAGQVTFAAVIDEEMESLGAEALIASGLRAEGAIVGEPTGNRLALGHKGLEWLEIAFAGRAAHGGTPEAGVNAINAAAHFVALVEQRLAPTLSARSHPLLGPPTINCGTIVGGDQPSTVAGHCLLRVDRRSVPGESFASVCGELRALMDDPPPPPPPRAACASVTGTAPRDDAFPAWTDAGLLANFASIPCVICGPGDLSVAHTPWESVPVAQVVEAGAIYREAALSFCGGAA